MYEICEKNNLSYTFGFSSNARLKVMTQGLIQRTIEQFKATEKKARLCEFFQYKCNSGSIGCTVVAKADCHEGGTNLRLRVTNLPGVITPDDGQKIYDDYIQRGESDHRMDELKNGLWADRLSCHRFMANFFRLMVHTAAFNFLTPCVTIPNCPRCCVLASPAPGE